ncbi:SAM-dependent methyltransferase (plasmid) [Streptomyces sp. BI20]|uniref:SAM-dependent methyltransferase n=1 Tax=Streptomyces sp. BI20 TaxID=3403460 RepID=UPI003C7908C8
MERRRLHPSPTTPLPEPRAHRASTPPEPDAVRAYYRRKTAEILDKYGPGPRVHFRLGLVGDGPALSSTDPPATHRAALTASQEAMLRHTAELWGVRKSPPHHLLDAGCGLGGGALYWAAELGSAVTALTPVPEHLPLVSGFARAAGVADRVTPLLGDVHDLAPDSPAVPARGFDAVYASESSGYFDRRRFFTTAARLVRPGGWVGVQEHFILDPRWAGPLDRYYRTRLGTRREYLDAAADAGLRLAVDEDVTAGVAGFWRLSVGWNEAESARLAAGGAPGGWSPERLAESSRLHRVFGDIWSEGGIETRLILFRRPR